MKPIRILAYLSSGATYLLIVLGGVVRITGSGMGCGDDWPLCNGRVFPPLNDIGTLIEWSHRLVASGISALVVALALLAFARRELPGVSGPGGPLRSALAAAALLVPQILLGAGTVWLDLHPAAVVLHLGTAMAMIAALVITGLRAGAGDAQPSPAEFRRGAVAGVWMAGAAVMLGGLTANLGAAGACLGFPLCSGEVWPSESNGGLSHLHWTHRLIAYALTLHLVGFVVRVIRRAAPAPIQRAAIAALSITLIQIVVGAGMMFSVLQPHWRATHVAAGTAVWVALVVLAWYSRPTELESGEIPPALTPLVSAVP